MVFVTLSITFESIIKFNHDTYTVQNLINFNRLWYTSGKLKLIDLYIMKNEYTFILNLITFQSKYIKINKHYWNIYTCVLKFK